ncbi:MAG: hypothetical protein KDB50_13020 [Mycobacterium sp.]|nr:hypothetical protein [Mycobacterium sp.]
MNTDPTQIRAEIDALLADLQPTGQDAGVSEPTTADAAYGGDIDEIDAVGRRLEQAHQILVTALESVEKG